MQAIRTVLSTHPLHLGHGAWLLLAASLLLAACRGGDVARSGTPAAAVATPPIAVDLSATLPAVSDLPRGQRWNAIGPNNADTEDVAFCRNNVGSGRYVQRVKIEFGQNDVADQQNDLSAAATDVANGVFSPLLLVHVSRLTPGSGAGYMSDWAQASETCGPDLAKSGATISSMALPALGDQSLAFHLKFARAANGFVLVRSGDLIIQIVEEIGGPDDIDAGLLERVARAWLARLNDLGLR